MRELGRAKIGLAVTALMVDVYNDFSEMRPGAKERIEKMTKALSPLGDVVCFGLIEQEADAVAARDEFIREDVDIVVYTALAYTKSAVPLRLLSRLDAPIVIWNTQTLRKAPPKSSIEDMWLDSGLAGIPGTTHALMRAGIRFSMLTSHLDDPDGLAELAAYVKAAQAARALRKARIITVGHVYDSMTDLMADHEDLHINVGPLAYPVDPCRVSQAAKNVPDKDVDRMVQRDRKRYGKIEIDDRSLRSCARLALGMEKVLLAEEKADAVALLDQTWLEDADVGVLPTYGFMHLNEMGVPCVCEMDVVTAAAQLIQEYLMGPTMLAEFYDMDFDADAVVLCHDSNGNPALAADPKDVVITTSPLFEGTGGAPAVCEFTCPPGDVTMLAVANVGTGWRLVVCEGQSLPTDPRPLRSPFLLFKHASKTLADFANQWCLTGGVHHFGIAYGKGQSQIAKLAHVMGLETVIV